MTSRGIDLLLGFAGALFIVGMYLYHRILRVLALRHQRIWASLGSPTLIKNNSIASMRKVRMFLRDRRHLELGDPQLNRLVKAERILNIGYFTVFGILMLTIGYHLVSSRS